MRRYDREVEAGTDATGRARSSPLAWVVVAIVGMLGSLGFAAVDRPPADGLGTAAERFLPADGAVSTLTLSTGESWIVETAISPGASAALQQPGVPGEQLLGSLLEEGGDDAALTVRFLRQLLTDPTGGNGQITELSTIGADGIRLRTVTGTPNGFVYTPGVLVLPATVRDGSVWRSSGDALPQGLIEYRHEASATAAPGVGGGCLLVDSEMVYLMPTDVEVRVVEATTWCPGLGSVAMASSIDAMTPDGPTAIDAVSIVGAPIGDPLDLVPPPPWSPPADWFANDPSFVIADPLFGESQLPHPVATPAVVTSTGIAVLVVDRELEAWRTDGERQVRAWMAHPGGVIVALGGAGELVLATTSTRLVVAYDDGGARRWQAAFDDVVLDAPVDDGAGGLIAVALDGEVRRLDAADGSTLWTARIGSDAEARAVVVGARDRDPVVIVGGRDGRVLALDLDTGDVRWSADTDPVGAIGVFGGEVVVAGIIGGITALDAATGTAAWDDPSTGIVERFAAADGVLVGLHSDGITAWTADGDEAWRLDGADEGLVGDGSTVVVLSPDLVRAIDGSGAVVAQWSVPTAWSGITRALVATPTGVWVVDSDHAVTAIEATP